MASADDLRSIALAMPGTAVAPHFDRIAYRARKIFATLAADGRSANLALTPDEQEMQCLMLPEAFVPVPNRWGQQGWTTVLLDRIRIDDLRTAVALAYEHARPAGKSSR